MAWFLRSQKLRTKSQSLRLTPKNDAANVPPFLPRSAAPTPFNRDWLPTVLASWTLVPILLWQNVQTPATPDLPPFGARPWLANVVGAWEPAPGAIQGRRFVPQGTVAASTQPSPRAWVSVVRSSWEAEQPAAQKRILAPIPTPDPPPFAANRWMAQVVRAWDPDPWLVPERVFQPQGAFYDPPWGAKSWIANVRQAWEPDPWVAQLRVRVPQQAAAAQADQPFTRPWVAKVVDSWQEEPPRQRARVLVVPPTPDEPPYGSKPWIEGVIASWVEEAPFVGKPAVKFVQTPAAQIDNPPFGLRSWAPTVRDAWEPPAYKPQVLAHVVQPAAADQPPGRNAWVAGLLEQWQPTWPRTQERRITVQGVTVNNPPFGAKPWVSGVITQWQPIPPERVIYRHVTAGSAFTPGVFPSESPVHFRAAPATRRLGEPTEAPKTARLGEPTESPEPERLGSADTKPPGEGLGS